MLTCVLVPSRAGAVVWQWSVADGSARAYLWVPPACERVRAVMVANHNMLEQGILEHPTMRRTLSDLGIAQVWVVPALDGVFDFNAGAGEHFQRVMDALAVESGYAELGTAPVVPIGHSACASYPWNFAAWNPGRTLAVLSVKGDAPQTNRTGYGRAGVEWGGRAIDGVPGLMVMGEYEWSEDRLTPAMDFIVKHPAAPVSLLANAGHGHYDFSDDLVAYLAMFVRKAAERRMPAVDATEGDRALKPVDPKDGWLLDRWRPGKPPVAPAAPYAQYTGDRREAFWHFDEESARSAERIGAASRDRKPQLVAFEQDGRPLAGEPCQPEFRPLADGVTFHLGTRFLDKVSGAGTNPARWAGLPDGTPLGHATGGGPIVIWKTVGPVALKGPDTFALALDRSVYTTNGRNNDIWLIAGHPGDDRYKPAVQQAIVRVSPNTGGMAQTITFPPVPDQHVGATTVKLPATSSMGLPVSYYVREGPAEVVGDVLTITPIPPRAKMPVRVTVVAWQWGRPGADGVRTAEQVERSFRVAATSQ